MKKSKKFLLALFSTILLFNLLVTPFASFYINNSATVYAQDAKPADGGEEKPGSIACYDPPKDKGIENNIWDFGAKVVNAIPGGSIVTGAIGTVADLENIVTNDPLKWFICGVSDMLAKTIDFVNVLVSRMMLFDPTKDESQAKAAYTEDCSTAIGGGGSDGVDPECANAAGVSTSGVNTLKMLWRNVLNVVNIVLIIAMLAMVISTALDIGIFSSYTVKKALPKIIVGAIAANLSWVICAVVISSVNYLGLGIQQVMIHPLVGNSSGPVAKLSEIARNTGYTAAETGGNVGIGFQGPIMLGIGGVAYMIFSSMGIILLPLVAAIAVAVFIAFIVFLLRRILLILLIMVSPIAFMFWALPGGEGVFKKWWKSFVQLLLVYPYAMVLLGSGVVVSSVISETGGGNLVAGGGAGNGVEDMLNAFLILLTLILPYILLPTAFKAITGVMGTLTGMLNDKSKGLIDRAKSRKDSSGWAQYRKRDKDSKAANRLGKYSQRKLQDKGSYLDRAKSVRKKVGSIRSGAYGLAGKAQTTSFEDLKRMGIEKARTAGSRDIDSLGKDEQVWRAQAQQHDQRGQSARNATIEMSKNSAKLIADQIASVAANDVRNNGGGTDAQLKAANAALERHAELQASKGDQIGFNQTVSKLSTSKGVENLERLQMKAMASPGSEVGSAWQASSQDSQVFSDRKALSPHLNANIGKVNPATGRPETIHEARAAAVEGASAAELSSMSKESFQAYYQAVEAKGQDPVAAINALETKINAQESTRATYKGGAKDALASPRRGAGSTGSSGTGVA